MTTTRAACNFIWYELMTTDREAALAFYSNVLGWTPKDAGMPGGPYTLVAAGPINVGGVMALPPEARDAGARPCWMFYVGVDDVDAYASRVKAAGGRILRGPEDISGIGRSAMAADPHGAPFMMMTPISRDPLPVPAPGAPGHVGWRELHAGDGPAAFQFYSGLFGWIRGEGMDMGKMGVYQLFTLGEEPVGAVMTKMPQVPAPFWMLYFQVDGLDAGMSRVLKNGGMVINGPTQVPGNDWIAQCTDPQGAMFALLAKKR